MYLEFYGLKEKPFRLTPDPAFLYYSKAHKRAVAFLKYGLQESKGFLQLTGPVGSGKTTLLRAILGDLDENARTAYVINPTAPFPDLLRSIMKDLEIPNIPQTRIKIELLDFFHDYLLLQMRRNNSVVVIFDEAQNLSIKNLEEIRMLSNFETTKGKLLQIVFVGQPELIETLDRPDLRQLKQRVQVRYNLSPLSQTEVKAYINHRLRVAGSDGSIAFSNSACKVIYDFSGGIPRLINAVCDVALLIGYVNERMDFDAEIIREAIGELGGSFDDESSDDLGPEEQEEFLAGEVSEGGTETEPPDIDGGGNSTEIDQETALPSGAETEDEQAVISKGSSSSIPRTAGLERSPENCSLPEIQNTSLAVIERNMPVDTEECLDAFPDSSDMEGNEEETARGEDITPLDDEPWGKDESDEPPISVPERETDEDHDSRTTAPEKHIISEEADLDEMLPSDLRSAAGQALVPDERVQPTMQAADSEEKMEALSPVEMQTPSTLSGKPNIDEDPPNPVDGLAKSGDLAEGEHDETLGEKKAATSNASLDLNDLMPTICIPSRVGPTRPGENAPRPNEEVLQSYLRHCKSGRFHVADSSFPDLAGVRMTLGERIRRMIGRDNGVIIDVLGSDGYIHSKENKTGPLGKRYSQEIRRPGKQRRYLPIQKPDTIKVAALMTNGKVILGRTSQISVRERGVYLSPPEWRKNKRQQFIPFRHTLALRFLRDYDDGWKRNCTPRITNPTGRELVVTLLNGDIIEGSTPQEFDTNCLRFFVFVIDDEGESFWTLVERAGTAGILTRDFKEGIYADEPLSLLELLETFILTDERICRHESSGDEYFSAEDFDAALREYSLAHENGADRERIEIKVALCHFNRGTKYLKQNKYQEAKREFLKVNTGGRLLEKARAKAIIIERMVEMQGIMTGCEE